MRTDNTTIHAVYGEHLALYRNKKDILSKKPQRFRDHEKAMLSMRNWQILVMITQVWNVFRN